MEFKEFTISDVFEKVDVKMINKTMKDFPDVKDAEYCIPLLTAQTTNNGFSRYAKRSDCPQILKNLISVAAAGTGMAFYQPNEFAILQGAYAVKLKDGTEFDEKTGLFFAIVLDKFLVDNEYCWTNTARWNKISNKKIWIPVKKDENGKEIIDFEYMREVVEEMEREVVEKIEKYLKVSGFDNCELTKEEKTAYDMELVDGAVTENEKEAREFTVDKLFTLKKITKKLSRLDLFNKSDKCKFPVYSSDSKNNGVIGYTNTSEFECNCEHPVFITFGDHTRTFNIARESFAVLDNVKVLEPCCNDDDVLIYLTSTWRKGIIDLGYSRHWKLAKDCLLLLPIQTDKTGEPIIDPEHKFHESGFIPDWDFMKNYVKAAEKEVIKGLAEENEKKIKKAKATIG